jgi:hypothetical protein
MKRAFFVAIAILELLGCATTKDWAATGGSRSDGTVKLSYQYSMFESPNVNMTQASNIAVVKCGAWGYSGAEAFGGEIRECTGRNGYGNCVEWNVSAEYQCLGEPKKK